MFTQASVTYQIQQTASRNQMPTIQQKVIRHEHTHSFNGPSSKTTQVSRYQKGKTNLDFTGTRDSEWQWHQLGDMQASTSYDMNNDRLTAFDPGQPG